VLSLCAWRAPSAACVAWHALVAAALHAVRSAARVPPLSMAASAALTAALLLLPVALACFAAAACSACGALSDAALAPFTMRCAASSGSKAYVRPCSGPSPRQSGFRRGCDTIAEEEEGDLEVTSDANAGDPESDLDASALRANAGAEVSAGPAVLDALAARQWERICVARRAILPPGAGYDSATGLVVDGYVSFSPLIANIVGSGNRRLAGAGYGALLTASSIGSVLAGSQVWALALATDLRVAAVSWVYAASALLILSALLCLMPLFDMLAALRVRSHPRAKRD